MSLFKYRAINGKGENVQGQFAAADRADVLKMLRENRLYPLSINEEKAECSGADSGIELFSGVGTKDIAFFCRQFSTMLNAGSTIIEVLEILLRQTENKKLRKAIEVVYEEVMKGNTLSSAMKQHVRVFPELLSNMVATGEVSGTLDSIMDRMAVNYEKESRIRNKVKSALVYPTVLSIVATMVVIFLLIFVLPRFISMFEQSGFTLPLPTRILLATGSIMKNYWYLILSGVVLLVFLISKWIGSEQGRLEVDRLILKIPIVGSVVQKIASSRFSRTLSILAYSGTPILEALDITARVVGNKAIAEGIIKARGDVIKGLELSKPIRELGIFPPMIDSMIKIGEESGSLDIVLEKTSDFYDEEVEASLQRLTSMLEPAIIVTMGAVIAFIILSVVLPMFDALEFVQ